MKTSSKTILTLLSAALAGTAFWLLWPRKNAPVAPHKATAGLPNATSPQKDGPNSAPTPTTTSVAAQSPAQTTVAPPLTVPGLPTASAVASGKSTVASTSPSASSPTAVATPAPVISPVERPEEIAATARMYAAHESLRTPEEADPDSKSNKRILQTMVIKVLARNNASLGAGSADHVLAQTK